MIDFAAVRARHNLTEVVARYLDLKRKGTETVGLCPFHADKNPSFTIYRGRDGNERYRCFSCGESGDVIDFLCAYEDIDKPEAVRRLEGEQLPSPSTRIPRPLPADEGDCWEPIVPVPGDATAYDPAQTYNPKRGKAVRYQPTLVTPYHLEDGSQLGYIVRLEFEDGSKVCPVITYCAGPGGERRWCAKRPKPPYPLVGCELLAKHPGKPVILVEGEKKRMILEPELPQFVLLSLLGGAEAVKVNDLSPLAGRNVTLWPDADVVGRRAMRDVAGLA